MTVIVPVYNAAAELDRSVPAVLALEGVDEWIWVDDGSSDGSGACIDRQIEGVAGARRLRHAENLGRAAARNTGIESASSEALLLLDADVSPPPELGHAAREALGRPATVAAVARLVPVPESRDDPYTVYLRRYPRGPQPSAPGDRLDWRHFLTTAVAVRREAVLEAGGFDRSVDYGEDIELASRLATLYPDGLTSLRVSVELRGVDRLDGVLQRMRAFGRSFAAMPERVAAVAELEAVTRPSWRRRLAGSKTVARMVRGGLRWMPDAGIALGVRYLLAHALVRAYLDASTSAR